MIPEWAHDCFEDLAEVLLAILFINVIAIHTVSLLLLESLLSLLELSLSLEESGLSFLKAFFSLDHQQEQVPALVVDRLERCFAHVLSQDLLLSLMQLQLFLIPVVRPVKHPDRAASHALMLLLHLGQLKVHFDFLLHGVEELGRSSQLACSSFHDCDELVLLDRAITILVSLLDHVLYLFVGELVSISKVREEVLELRGVQAATSIPVQELECGLELLIR